MASREEIDAKFDATCADIVQAVGMGLSMGLARQKGKTAAEVKHEFFVSIAKMAYRAGYDRGTGEANEAKLQG